MIRIIFNIVHLIFVGETGVAKDSQESIFNSYPDEQGGRIARRGFNYQDHVGAKLCLELLEHPEFSEIWFECIDDIIAIRIVNGEVLVEMIQVKTDNPVHRWTLSYLSQREKKKKGTSIIEKSLFRAKYREKTHFRIVVNHEIVKDLEKLTTPLQNYSVRKQCSEIDKIVTKGEENLGNVNSPTGVTLRDWFYTLHLDKHEDTIFALTSCNIYSFGKILLLKKHRLAIDQCEEIYQSLLAYVKRSSEGLICMGDDNYKIRKGQLEDWLEIKIKNFDVGLGSEKMVKIMQDAGMPEDIIEGAKSLREYYVSERLGYGYTGGADFNRIEAYVIAALQKEKAKLDSGEILENGIEFHSRCLSVLDTIVRSEDWGGNKPSIALLQGCMYNLTNRGVHRFRMAEP